MYGYFTLRQPAPAGSVFAAFKAYPEELGSKKDTSFFPLSKYHAIFF